MSAQRLSSGDTLILQKSLMGNEVYLNGVRQSPNDLVKMSFNYAQANHSIRRARNNYYASFATGIVGLALVFGSFKGNSPGELANWPVTGAGAVVFGTSFVFYTLYIKQTKKGIHYYNQGM